MTVKYTGQDVQALRFVPDSSVLGWFPTVTGEIGVTNNEFPYGYSQRHGAKFDGLTDDSTAHQNAIDSVAAISSPISGAGGAGGTVTLGTGNTVITVPLVLTAGIILKGQGRHATIITKTTTTTSTGRGAGPALDCAVYVVGTSTAVTFGHQVRDLKIQSSVSTASNSAGIAINAAAMCQFENINVQGFYNGMRGISGFLTTVKNVRCGSQYGYSFDWGSTADAKTTLMFENCYSEGAAGGYNFRATKYSSMHSCACDVSNANGYNAGYPARGDRTVNTPCYQFYACEMTMSGCGSEQSWGSFVSTSGQSYVSLHNCYITTLSLNASGTTPQAVVQIADASPVDGKIFIDGCHFGDAGANRTGTSTAIYTYYVNPANTSARIIVDEFDTVGGAGVAGQSLGRVYSIANVMRGTLPTVLTAGEVYSQTATVGSQASGVATTHYTLTLPGVYEVAAYGYGGVNYVADATIGVSSTGALTLLRTNSSHASFAISVSGTTVQVTQSNGTTLRVDSRLVNRMLA